MLLMYELYNMENVLYHDNTLDFHSIWELQPVIVVNAIVILHFLLNHTGCIEATLFS